MKVVILAGGLGTRLAEETDVRPKPMVEIGGQPILWHIMKIYSRWGINEMIVCLGYKGRVIKQYFAEYAMRMSDITFDMRTGTYELHRRHIEPWKITLVDTGDKTMTGGRLKRVRDYVSDGTFCCTYGDGVSDVNIPDVIRFHQEERALATLTAVNPPGRFGVISLKEGATKVMAFREKPHDADSGWINGGFFVLEPQVLDYIDEDSTVFEQQPLQKIAREGMLAAYRHEGFWHSMDTLRDKNVLEEYWKSGKAPWKVWSD